MAFSNGNGNGGIKLVSLISPILTVVLLLIGMALISSQFVSYSDLNSAIMKNSPYLADKDKIMEVIHKYDSLEKELRADINEIKLEQGRISTKLDLILGQYRKR